MAEPGQDLTTFSEAERMLALYRFALLRPILEQGASQSDVAASHEIPLRTLQRWLHAYHRQGLVGLVRQSRSDRGSRRRLPTELVKVIEGLALQKPPQSVATIHRTVTQLAAEQAWPQPSYSRVYDIVQKLNPALITLAQERTKAYHEQFDLVYRREAPHANAMWQADHTLLPLWLLNEQGQPTKPWLTVILDDYSWAVAGYFLGFRPPTALQTALTLHQAIWRKAEPHWPVCGIPATFYTDHGSDFTSQHLEQVAADLKMRLIFSLPGMPRGRGKVERFFGTVKQMFVPQRAGYAPEGSSDVTPTLTLPELDTQFRTWLLEDYHQRVQEELQSTPLARWLAEGFLPRMPDSLAQLDLLLLTVARARQVHTDGIHFHGYRYLDTTLAAYVGEAVTIRYDPRDLAEVRVFYQDAFLCRAICPELAGETLSLKEIIQARNGRRQQVRHEVEERIALVEQLMSASAPEPPVPEVEPPVAHPRLKRYLHE